MIIGILEVKLYAPWVHSLKEKRMIVKSLTAKVRNKFNVSVAETGSLDSWNHCELGAVCISNEASHADSMLSSIVNYVESDGWLEITGISTELIHTE